MLQPHTTSYGLQAAYAYYVNKTPRPWAQ